MMRMVHSAVAVKGIMMMMMMLHGFVVVWMMVPFLLLPQQQNSALAAAAVDEEHNDDTQIHRLTSSSQILLPTARRRKVRRLLQQQTFEPTTFSFTADDDADADDDDDAIPTTQTTLVTATEFCSKQNLRQIEIFLTTKLLEKIPYLQVLTEEQNYVCSCLLHNNIDDEQDDSSLLTLECGIFFLSNGNDDDGDDDDGDDDDDSSFPISTVEYMTFQRLLPDDYDENSTHYYYYVVPSKVGRWEYLNGNKLDGPNYCEDLILQQQQQQQQHATDIDDENNNNSSNPITIPMIDKCFVTSDYYNEICSADDDTSTGDNGTNNNSTTTNTTITAILTDTNNSTTTTTTNTTTAVQCEVCDDGQTIHFVFNSTLCNNITTPVTCEQSYIGPYLFEYYVENSTNIKIVLPAPVVDEDNDDDNCVNDLDDVEDVTRSNLILPPEELCEHTALLDMGFFLTDSFKLYYPDLEVVVPYGCSCLNTMTTTTSTESTSSSSQPLLTVSCDLFYVDNGGSLTLRRETMEFTRTTTTTILSPSQNNNDNTTTYHSHSYLVPSQMEFCTSTAAVDFTYCESYTFGYLQNEFITCEFSRGLNNGGNDDIENDDNAFYCEASFCELCSNGLSVAHTCGGSGSSGLNDDDNNNNKYFTCNSGSNDQDEEQQHLGPFLFAYKDVKLDATTLCDQPTTEVPEIILPTTSPTSTTQTTSVPNNSPSTSFLPTNSPVIQQLKTLNPTLAVTNINGDENDGDEEKSSGGIIIRLNSNLLLAVSIVSTLLVLTIS